MMDRKLLAAVDVGQATTQAALFESVGLSLRLQGLVRRPTPVDEGACLRPVVLSALTELAAKTRVRLLDGDGGPLVAGATGQGPDGWYVTTDSFGPLRVAVAGVIDDISGQSALKAALVAGAAVAGLFAINDGREEHEKIRDLSSSPVDAVLLAGGVDEGLYAGGGGRQVVNMARTIARAAPRLRHNPAGRACLVYAGSSEARSDVTAALGAGCEVLFADNVRPDMGLENLGGARRALLELFSSQTVSAGRRWRGLVDFAGSRGIMPTAVGCANATELLAAAWRHNVLVADISEATINIYSSIDRQLNRTVTDEVGLNYGNPISLADLASAAAVWSPSELPAEVVANILGLARRRPAAVPQTWGELMVRQFAARERLRVALEAHRKVAALVKGVRRQRNLDEVFGAYVAVGGQTIVDLSQIKLILATGRMMAEATSPGQILGLVLDGLGPQGITQVLWDPSDLWPHLGALSQDNEALAAQVLGEEWLARLALVVAPIPDEGGGALFKRQGQRLATVRIERENGAMIQETVDFGGIKRIALEPGETVRVTAYPERGYNAGAGRGATSRLSGGGELGVVLDGRGRPIIMPGHPARRRAKIASWLAALAAYPLEGMAVAAPGGGDLL